MTVEGHEFDHLAAHAERQLDAATAARVALHVERCAECQAALQEIRRGIGLAGELGAEPISPILARGMRDRLVSGGLAGPRSRPRVAVRVAAAAAVLVAGSLLYWQANRPWADLRAAHAAPTAFEQEGRDVHRRFTAGETPEFSGSTDADLWRWLGRQRAPVTGLRPERSGADAARFVPIGAAVRNVAGARASVLSYRVDGRPVTLVLAHARDVADAPSPGWWKKRITHRREKDGVSTMTWTVGAGTYVLVSELEGAGQRACFLCHTDRHFQDAISTLSIR